MTDVISYIKMKDLAESLQKELDDAYDSRMKIRTEMDTLLGAGENVGAWTGDAASAYSVKFSETFLKTHAALSFFATVQSRLLQASEAYAMADKQAQGIADAIEQANWAEV